MSGQAVAPAGNGGVAAGAQQSWQDRAWPIAKNVGIFLALQLALRQFMGSGKSATPAAVTPTPSAVPSHEVVQSSEEGGYAYAATPATIFPLWPSNSSIDITMYISSSVALPAFHAIPAANLILAEKAFAIESKTKETRSTHRTISIPRNVQDNGTLWAHIFVAQSGFELDPASSSYDPAKAYRILRPLTQYLAKKKIRKTRNLLNATTTSSSLDNTEDETPSGPNIASYYHPNLTLSFVPSDTPIQYATLNPALAQYYPLSASRDSTGQNGYYYPPLYLNTFWQLKTHMTELNLTIPSPILPLNVDLSTLTPWQFNIMASMDEGMKETARKAARGETTPGGGDGSEMELIKETLLDTNPWLLGTTLIVSIFHMLFELLAFKSDVGHWRKKKDNVGVSVRTILSNVVMQAIIFLYLLDNNESTSWMILFGQGTGIAIEAWKVTKMVDVRIRTPAPASYAGRLGLPKTVVFEDKHALSETEEKTEEYDKIAFKYMGYIAVPLLLAYAAYSLKYDTHKSWYSFVIATLVGSVYAYGFLMMVRCFPPPLPSPSSGQKPLCSCAKLILVPGALALHQLPPAVRRAHARARHDVQIPQHLHRRPLRLHHQDAPLAPPRDAEGRCDFLRVFVSGVEVQGRLHAGE